MRSLVVPNEPSDGFFTELLAHKGYVVTGHMLVCYDCMALAEYGHQVYRYTQVLICLHKFVIWPVSCTYQSDAQVLIQYTDSDRTCHHID